MPQYRIVGCKVDGGEVRKKLATSKGAPFALGAALAALAVCTSYSAARAGDDTAAETSFTDKVLQTLGLKDPNSTQYEINYSERSPLVVPPTRNLPPPVTAGTAPAPNWPKDPDITRRQTVNDDDKPSIRPFDSVTESSRPLRPDELGVHRATPAVAAPGTSEQTTRADTGATKNLFSFDWMKKEQYATFTGEPPRASLTDPPAGYLTPSPDQPYGIAPEKKVYKPPTLGQRMEPQR
jgi:hypothetical protein